MFFAASQSVNPILPATGEVIWSVISFVVLMALFIRFVFPPVRTAMVARSEKIRTDIEAAELARNEAEETLAQYRAQLEEARRESTRLLEEARVTASGLREELLAQAGRDAAAIVERAEDSLRGERERVVSELRGLLGDLAVDLAERILEVEIDRLSIDPLIDRFVAEVSSEEV
jgi:F-type H+-transporting ATPase subunit b